MLKYACSDTAMDTAYHEAGHVVAGMGLGCRPEEVYIREDSSGGVRWLDWAEGQSIAQVRRELVHLVAGPLAEFLHEAEESMYTRSRWADRLDPGDWEVSWRLLSARIRRGETGDEAARCDTAEAWFLAREVCRRLTLHDAGRWDERRVRADILHQHGRADFYWVTGPFVAVREGDPSADEFEMLGDEEDSEMSFRPTGPITPPEVAPAEVLAEVVRAERWAERLLRRRWAAVTAVAEALYRSKSGSLTGKRVQTLISSADRSSRSRAKRASA
ncbi:hypothetical protein [Urbifossiella limnaea]|uniref:Peptidase M41 domain-containing protein n=1 Tax=Urbifossiella limnaea TaxID=2528023 RepID=A0A517XSY0_9BACT|nr:hypothetical protein [Urbifossiella limnaea]QDU20601.1 hypothetical protein ETAA1_25560 [Urbifossiella limnaea]